MTDRTTRHARLDSIDRAGRLLLGVGGCLSAAFMVIIAGGLVLVTMVFLVGMAQDPQRMTEEAGPGGLVIIGVVVVLALVVLLGWWFGLKGSRVALTLLVPAGLVLALLTANTYLDFDSGLDRGEDVQFLLFFMAAVAAPLSMAAGAVLRLVSSLMRPKQAEG